MSNLLAAVRAREVQVSDARVEVEGYLIDSPPRFGRVELRVTAECRDREMLERLIEIADRGCVMMNTLRGTLDVSVVIGAAVQ